MTSAAVTGAASGSVTGTVTGAAARRRRASAITVYRQITTGERAMTRASTAQVRIAAWVWPSISEATSETASTAAQNRCTRKVSSRSALLSPPLGVTTKRHGRRVRAAVKDFR